MLLGRQAFRIYSPIEAYLIVDSIRCYIKNCNDGGRKLSFKCHPVKDIHPKYV